MDMKTKTEQLFESAIKAVVKGRTFYQWLYQDRVEDQLYADYDYEAFVYEAIWICATMAYRGGYNAI